MDDSDLDTLLTQARPDGAPPLGHELVALEASIFRRLVERRRTRYVGAGAALAGAVALTGASLYVMPGLEAWPWSSLRPGEVRVDAVVPVYYIGDIPTEFNDQEINRATWCGAVLDVTNASDGQIETLNAEIAAYEWPRLEWGYPREATHTESMATSGSQMAAIEAELSEFVTLSRSQIGWLPTDDDVDGAARQGAHVSAFTVSCNRPGLAQ